ncbi:CPBP family intramembrane glutamic endopeptidase [Pseudomarimonas arenosa]|uniref:CPBP family intramembrane metalloprotease n=1 Tax=Pseudomarimonas arenosa TaxID=2774145 RepID=A0AAW3ZPW4_9GAMM|nr:CPBP family intramembrane glutamic endopeptidase [Pseudomarimonas arenosa]MBD8528243.1 CPBP family intramembrane metalloprotease [Pseudomarimonas arenosa]
MKKLLIDAHGRWRNGVWIVLFLALFLASRLVYTPVLRWLRAHGIDEVWLEPAKFCFVLLVTWICLLLRRQDWSSVGLRLNRAWAQQAGAGLLIGCASVGLAVLAMWLLGSVTLQLNPSAGLATLLSGLYVFCWIALFEETLFRGFLFQRLIDGSRPWIAQLLFGVLFASAHWGNPDMQGSTLLIASFELFLGSILLGLAYLRTGSLALPVGLHLGWNWMQGSVLGFGVSGFSQAGLWQVERSGAEWIHGGSFGLEASVFAILVDLLMIAMLWRWKAHRPALLKPEAHLQQALTGY